MKKISRVDLLGSKNLISNDESVVAGQVEKLKRIKDSIQEIKFQENDIQDVKEEFQNSKGEGDFSLHVKSSMREVSDIQDMKHTEIFPDQSTVHALDQHRFSFFFGQTRPRAKSNSRYLELKRIEDPMVKEKEALRKARKSSSRVERRNLMECEASMPLSCRGSKQGIQIDRLPLKRISSRMMHSRSQILMDGEGAQDRSIGFSSHGRGNEPPLKKMLRKVQEYIQRYKKKHKRFPATIPQFYSIGKIIGRGAFGKVHLAIHKLSSQFVAIKSLPKKELTNEKQIKKVKQETSMLKKIRHPSLVNLLQNFQTPSHILFVMELCAGGDLLSYVRRRRHLKESVAKFIFWQIIRGIQYCHNKNIIHRDIKLENILLDARGQVKICDFGVSRVVEPGDVIRDKTGTPAYIAPEIILDEGYSYPVDIWSAGVVLYAMLEGAVPFRGEDLTELRKNILLAKYQMPEEISKEAKNLLRRILVIDPKKRIQIPEILEHRWMQDIDQEQFLFTPTELDLLRQQFFYIDSPSKRYGEETFFTQHQLETEPQENQNQSERSYILAPFNTEESKVNFDFTHDERGLMKTARALQFTRKVRQINRDYEATHCKELDNGVYHRFAYNSEEGVEILCHNELCTSKRSSINEEHISTIRTAINRLAEVQTQQSSLLRQNTGLVITVDEAIVKDMENLGFPRALVFKSLQREEYNHSSATYYLLLAKKQPSLFNLEFY